MSTTTEVLVHRSVAVPLSPAEAFDLFTARMSEFWPADHHIGDAPPAAVLMEPHAGGRWYERAEDGTECDWGKVAEWSPPDTVVLLWQLGADWRYDPALGTEVEVTFTEESPGRTRLDLRHRHLERYGDQAEQMRTAFESPQAWAGILDCYAAAVRR